MKSELQHWNITTAVAPNLAVAMGIAFNTKNASALSLWPLKDEKWLVVAKFRILPN